ncbi:MAG TPA: LysR family transcriptional regulator [Syntrophales bacterium]|nr:LysR family transcriptional regulator [Syntrophales bacterium]HQB29368.1 LysR family transcriptional regulator [Syntrophales bacterium]HQN78701.1 LysR family transcriptional regulator [Syntrophales bacterium]HQQ26787.1 LysR family transcriptional regulator [Syntrophales bacterium]
MEIKHKIWLEQDGKVIFGKGRDVLLKAIDECRSLNAAARKLNMSYRAAWGRLRASEERMGIKLVEKDPSGKGMHLTEDARRLIAMFEKTDGKISRLLEKAHKELPTHTAVKPGKPSSP